MPDLTVLLDIPVESSIKRRPPRATDRFEAELPGQEDGSPNQTFHEKVRLGFLSLSGQTPDKWLVVDATLPLREVSRLVRVRISELLKLNGV